MIKPHPPVTRALTEARDKLVVAGINVVDWEPYKHDHGLKIIVSIRIPVRASRQKTRKH